MIAASAEETVLLTTLQKLLSFQLTLVEWIVLALLVAVPYAVIGVVWTITHGDRFVGLDGVPLAASILGSVVSWPVQLLATACVS